MSRAMMIDLQPEEENADTIEQNEVEEIQQEPEAKAKVKQPPVEEPESNLPEKVKHMQGIWFEDTESGNFFCIRLSECPGIKCTMKHTGLSMVHRMN